MSKTSKKITKEKNLQKKRARKAANRAKYDSWKLSGDNFKSKRSRKSIVKNKRVKTINHKDGKCGNIACQACDPGKIFKI